jgi:peptide/nickel transport system permease protein
MAQDALSFPRAGQVSERAIKPKTYWGSVRAKLFRDRLTMVAIVLLSFMIAISVAAPWISGRVLGFSPTNVNLRERSKPPTWGAAAWTIFQQFTASCAKPTGCQWALWGPILSSSAAGLQACFTAGPGVCHWMGTDEAGRDVLARGIHGGRISLRIGLYVAAITMTLGVLVGLVSGYFATTAIDDVINAIVMTLSSIPLLFLLIILSRIFTPSPEGLALLIGIFGWMGVSRLIRGEIFSVREREYVMASLAIGCTTWRVLSRHILPNIASIVIVSAVFTVAGAIIAEAGLSYLGVGIGPPLPSWGNMMQGSLDNFSNAPWLVLAPGIFIFLTTLSIYLIGDGLRDALDPWISGPRSGHAN